MAKSVYQQVHEAIDRYEEACQDGELTFTSGEFADEAPDTVSGWIGSNLAGHLPAMDFTAAGAR